MKVTAAAGLKVPTEGNPRKYITDADQVEIEPTAYYLRRLADNELQEVVAVHENPTGKGAGEKPAKTGKVL